MTDSMKLSPQKIQHIAKLARLELSEKETKMYADQLSVVLDYVEMLNEVNTKNVAETCQVTRLKNIVREDVVVECDKEIKKKIIKQFPEQKDGMLKVKTVFSS